MEQRLESLEYNVADFYHKTGLFQAVARSAIFGNFTLFFICINAIYLGIDTNVNREGTPEYNHIVFQICEQIFCMYFFVEWVVRFGAFARKANCFRDTWFKFDTLLVFLMVGETWVLAFVNLDMSGGGSFLSVLRLLRLARMTRILRSIPELWTLLKGMKAATRAVSATLALLVVFIYLFGIVFHLMLGDSSNDEIADLYGTLPRCMWILLMTGTFMDNITGVLKILSEENPLLVGVFLIFVLLSALTVMNMLIGVLCEVVSAVAKAESDNQACMEINATVGGALADLDTDRNGSLSKDELIDISNSVSALRDIGVDPEFFNESVQMLFDQEQLMPLARCLEWTLLWRMEEESTVANCIQSANLTKWQFNQHFDSEMGKLAALRTRRELTEARLAQLSENQRRIEQQLVGFSEQLETVTASLIQNGNRKE